jgi:predicted transcriptional regulator
MRCLLISIKPKYCEAIYRREKRYEFRRRCPKINSSTLALVYESAPKQHISGWIKLSAPILGGITELVGLVGEDDPYKACYGPYLSTASRPGGMLIEDSVKLGSPLNLREFLPQIKQPPQSYQFVSLTPLQLQRLFDQIGPIY